MLVRDVSLWPPPRKDLTVIQVPASDLSPGERLGPEDLRAGLQRLQPRARRGQVTGPLYGPRGPGSEPRESCPKMLRPGLVGRGAGRHASSPPHPHPESLLPGEPTRCHFMGHDLSPPWSSRGTQASWGVLGARRVRSGGPRGPCSRSAPLERSRELPGLLTPRLRQDAERRWSRGPGPRSKRMCPHGAAAPLTGAALPARLLGLLPATPRPAHFTGGQVEPRPCRAPIPTQACNSTAQAPHRAPGSLPDAGHPDGWLHGDLQAWGGGGGPWRKVWTHSLAPKGGTGVESTKQLSCSRA